MLALRILEITFPIFSIVGIGLIYGYFFRPDMALPNRINTDCCIAFFFFFFCFCFKAYFKDTHSHLQVIIIAVPSATPQSTATNSTSNPGLIIGSDNCAA